jgi:hypothetical protein
MSQISSIPRTMNAIPQLPALFGLASCLSKIQLEGWTNDLIIHLDKPTAHQLQTKQADNLNNCLKIILNALEYWFMWVGYGFKHRI